MKKMIVVFAIVLLAVLTVPLHADGLEQGTVDWDAFNKNLAVALNHSNPGVRTSAYSLISQYASYPGFHVSCESVYDICREFRNTKNDESVRLMAMVALYKTGDTWAMDFLKRHAEHEKDQRIKRVCCSMCQKYFNPASEQQEQLLATK